MADHVLHVMQVCWEKVTQNASWAIFLCRHGMCTVCYGKLLQQPWSAVCCPLCRMPLMEPRNTAHIEEGIMLRL